MSVDEQTARDAARIRRRAAVGAAVLSGVLAALTGVFAATSPAPVGWVMLVGLVIAAASLVGCLVVASANRALEAAPGRAAAVASSRLVLVLVPLAWVVGVVVVGITTAGFAWVLLALGLVVVALPAVVVAALTVRGPHPAAAADLAA